MIIENFKLTDLSEKQIDNEKDLILCAFNRVSSDPGIYSKLREKYPTGDIVTFSTSGHFISSEIHDEIPVVSAIKFEKSKIKVNSYYSRDFDSCLEMGESVGSEIGVDSKGVCIISDGGVLNGTDLIAGINKQIKTEVPLFGGMAGDSTRFEKTLVGLNEEASRGKVVSISFYGDDISIHASHDSAWTSLGLEFKITKSDQNELFELNNRNAYEILYDFLGSTNEEDFTKDTLYYPFSLETDENSGVIRTPIGVDHQKKTLTYAGNMPEGSTVHLMKSGTMQLLDSTLEVAENCAEKADNTQLVFAISCVGRRVVLDDMANEEFTELNTVFGNDASYFGFYSYGEFSRAGFEDNCKLHNQTLTLAVLSEN